MHCFSSGRSLHQVHSCQALCLQGMTEMSFVGGGLDVIFHQTCHLIRDPQTNTKQKSYFHAGSGNVSENGMGCSTGCSIFQKGATGFTLHSPYCLGTLYAVSHVHSMNPKFLSHRELLKEIGPELKHIFVKFRLETGHREVHRKLGEGTTRFFNIG